MHVALSPRDKGVTRGRLQSLFRTAYRDQKLVEGSGSSCTAAEPGTRASYSPRCRCRCVGPSPAAFAWCKHKTRITEEIGKAVLRTFRRVHTYPPCERRRRVFLKTRHRECVIRGTMLDTLSCDSHLHSRIHPLHYLFRNVHFVPFRSSSLFFPSSLRAPNPRRPRMQLNSAP